VEEVAVNEFFFAKPEMLWLLAVTLPLLVWFLRWSWRKRQQLIGQFVRSPGPNSASNARRPTNAAWTSLWRLTLRAAC
jgi:hypothetical protein